MISAFLDIETSWERTITIIGIYRSGEGTTQLVAPEINRALLLQTLQGVERVYTYNGTGFDLPVIERWLGVKVAGLVPHRDLGRGPMPADGPDSSIGKEPTQSLRQRRIDRGD